MAINEQIFQARLRAAREQQDPLAGAILCRLFIAEDPSMLRTLREARGFTQSQLAELLGVHQTLVSLWENGKHLPDQADCFKIVSHCVYGASDDRLGPLRHLRQIVQPVETHAQEVARARAYIKHMQSIGQLQELDGQTYDPYCPPSAYPELAKGMEAAHRSHEAQQRMYQDLANQQPPADDYPPPSAYDIKGLQADYRNRTGPYTPPHLRDRKR